MSSPTEVRRRERKVRASMTWSDVAELMDKIAADIERHRLLHRKLEALHRGLARDLRALVAGKLVRV